MEAILACLILAPGLQAWLQPILSGSDALLNTEAFASWNICIITFQRMEMLFAWQALQRWDVASFSSGG